MLRFFPLAAFALALGCTTILGIDGEFRDEAPGGAAGASGGGGSAGADSGLGGSGGMGLVGVEDCLNGKDDNDDDQVDCADSTCQDKFGCEPAAPAGFMGPVVVWTGAGTETPPPCADPQLDQLSLFDGLTAPPADCSSITCQCSKTKSLNCLALIKYQGGTCTASGSYTPLSGGCFNFSVGVPSNANFLPGSSGNLECTAFPLGQATLPEVNWKNRYALCFASNPGAGCAGDLCVPKPDSNYTKRCVYKKGSASCPAAFPTALNLFSGVTDQRGCTPCTCDDTASCSVSVEEFSGKDCPGSGAIMPSGGACLPVSGSSQRSVQVTATTPDCVPQDGAAVGTATPSGPMTVCCE